MKNPRNTLKATSSLIAIMLLLGATYGFGSGKKHLPHTDFEYSVSIMPTTNPDWVLDAEKKIDEMNKLARVTLTNALAKMISGDNSCEYCCFMLRRKNPEEFKNQKIGPSEDVCKIIWEIEHKPEKILDAAIFPDKNMACGNTMQGVAVGENLYVNRFPRLYDLGPDGDYGSVSYRLWVRHSNPIFWKESAKKDICESTNNEIKQIMLRHLHRNGDGNRLWAWMDSRKKSPTTSTRRHP